MVKIQKFPIEQNPTEFLKEFCKLINNPRLKAMQEAKYYLKEINLEKVQKIIWDFRGDGILTYLAIKDVDNNKKIIYNIEMQEKD